MIEVIMDNYQAVQVKERIAAILEEIDNLKKEDAKLRAMLADFY